MQQQLFLSLLFTAILGLLIKAMYNEKNKKTSIEKNENKNKVEDKKVDHDDRKKDEL